MTVGVSQEVLDVDFSLQLVRASRVSGHVDNPDGTRSSGGNVNLTPEGAAGRRRQPGHQLRIANQLGRQLLHQQRTAGRYTLRARSNDTDRPLSASQPLSVAGGNFTIVGVVLAKGGTVSGTVAFESTQTPVPGDLTQVRVEGPVSTDPSDMGPNPNARVDKNGAFTLDGVSAGSHLDFGRTAAPRFADGRSNR